MPISLPYFRHVSIAIALLTATGAAQAQTTIITREPVQTETVVTTQPLQLTPAQRQRVYRTIVHARPAGAPPTVQYRIGMRVPETVQLYTVPDEVAVEVPTVRPYKYMVVNDRVWLVDPATSEVIAELAD